MANPASSALMSMSRSASQRGVEHFLSLVNNLIVLAVVMEADDMFLCQLTCQSADIMSSLCGVGVRVRVNNFFSKTTRPRDMVFFFKRYLIYRG